ncbi:MAG: GtrA family protein [Aerococcus sp.]|nr:GtrA family protein [Aerococcus sp.]
MRHLFEQFIKFGIVGVIATVIDLAVYLFLTKISGTNYLWANVMSFSISTIFNYWASMRYVFESKYSGVGRIREAVIFVVLSILGLGVQQFSLWVAVAHFMLGTTIGKLAATGVSMVFNFVTRKILLEK